MNIKYLNVFRAKILLICFCGIFETVEELIPLQDIRVVRDNSEPMTSIVTENPFLGTNGSEVYPWLQDVIKDVAYYLRNHKFNEYDRRYETHPDRAVRMYHGMFPRPPLRSLHWEVHKYCEPSFLSCMEYFRKVIKDVGIKRSDDTSIVVQEQGWNVTANATQVNQVDEECNKAIKRDNYLGDPFQGPIERFQWRTTASYFMCWYTMNKVTDLMYIDDMCDNFANCLDENFGVRNSDVRVDNNKHFSCALYSFCPDPCCPNNKHMSTFDTCWHDVGNPCFEINPNKRQCTTSKSRNQNFHDIILNRWNVSCHCLSKGFQWSSRYSICVDVDECVGTKHGCENETEICINLPGSYECGCKWGYMWSLDANHCVVNDVLSAVNLERKEEEEKEEERKAKSIVKRIFKLFSKSACFRYSISLVVLFTNVLISVCV